MLAKPDKSSQRVSQVRLGDNLAMKDRAAGYVLVISEDGYEGWVERTKTRRSKSCGYAKRGDVVAVEAPFEPISSEPKELDVIETAPMGSVLQVVGKRKNGLKVLLPDRRVGFLRTGTVRPARRPFPKEDAEAIVRRALGLVGTPYLWGGTTPWGFDCSGFVQLVFRMGGYQLLRDADMQFMGNGKPVPRQEMIRGDLLFFRGRDSSKVSHVAISLDKRTMVHASGSRGFVTVEPISTLGKLLIGVKRVV